VGVAKLCPTSRPAATTGGIPSEHLKRDAEGHFTDCATLDFAAKARCVLFAATDRG